VRTMSAIDVEGDEQLQLRYEHQEFLPGAAMNSMARPRHEACSEPPLSFFDTTQNLVRSIARDWVTLPSVTGLSFRDSCAALTGKLY
jgi:hypothetical protein